MPLATGSCLPLMLLGRNQLRNWIAGTVRRERIVGVDDAGFAVHGVNRDLKQVAQVPRPRCARNTIRAEYADVVWVLRTTLWEKVLPPYCERGRLADSQPPSQGRLRTPSSV